MAVVRDSALCYDGLLEGALGDVLLMWRVVHGSWTRDGPADSPEPWSARVPALARDAGNGMERLLRVRVRVRVRHSACACACVRACACACACV